MENDELYDKTMEAINELFGDTSVSSEETRSRLKGLIDDIQELISTLPEEE